MKKLFVLLAVVLGASAGRPPGAAVQAPEPKVILITLDGARTEEIFDGLDTAVLASTLREGQKIEEH